MSPWDRSGSLYVMRFSDGVVKIGYSNNPEARRRAIANQPNHRGTGLAICWVSPWLDRVAHAEARAKAALGSRPFGGRASTEHFRCLPQKVIAAAKRALALHAAYQPAPIAH